MARVFRSVTWLPQEKDTFEMNPMTRVTWLPQENDTFEMNPMTRKARSRQGTAVGTGLVEGQSDASTAIGIDIDIVSAGSATVSGRVQRVIPMAMRMLVATVRDIGKERPSKRKRKKSDRLIS